MVKKVEPITLAVEAVLDEARQQGYSESRVILMSPAGQVFKQHTARRLAEEQHLVFICGHYEGIDERVIERLVDEEISIGDYILTGGEIPAMALADCLCRMVDGVLPEESCYTDESHWNGLLEYPQYSRPEEWHGRKVPEVLLSGHHGNVADWRTRESYKRTMARRPDLWEKFDLTQVHSRHEKKVLAQALEEFRQEQGSAAETEE